jgi:hypothetical protein
LFEKDDKIPRMTAYGPRQLELQQGKIIGQMEMEKRK